MSLGRTGILALVLLKHEVQTIRVNHAAPVRGTEACYVVESGLSKQEDKLNQS